MAIEEAEEIVGEIDPQIISRSGLFQISFQDRRLNISFSHDLYFRNFPELFSSSELLAFASLLLQKNLSFGRDDVLGKLHEHTGNFVEAQRIYTSYARMQYKIAPLKSLFYFEKSLQLLINVSNPFENTTNSDTTVIGLVFDILRLYNKYNFLSSRQAPNLFHLLRKHNDFRQLNLEQTIDYYYYLGLKFTKEENFGVAREQFDKAYQILLISEGLSQDLIDKIIPCIGINLKHLGERKKSLDFFELAVQKWYSPEIQLEQYSNLAAYYLTSKPQKSLEYYTRMLKDFSDSDSDSVHLLIDFAMANFYIGNIDKAEEYLSKALPMAKKQINLSEEARAENILGIIRWRNNLKEVSESYFDIALSNGELANNHRWIWRIRTNLAQVAFHNGNLDKAYNYSWAVVDHLLKTSDSLIQEANNSSISSRRFAAIKAIAFLFYKMNKQDDLGRLERMFSFDAFTTFLNKMASEGNLSFDEADTNLFGAGYCILG